MKNDDFKKEMRLQTLYTVSAGTNVTFGVALSRIYNNVPGGVSSLTTRYFLDYSGSIYYYHGVYRFYNVVVNSAGVITGFGFQLAQSASGVTCYQVSITNGQAVKLTNQSSTLISSSMVLCKL